MVAKIRGHIHTWLLSLLDMLSSWVSFANILEKIQKKIFHCKATATNSSMFVTSAAQSATHLITCGISVNNRELQCQRQPVQRFTITWSQSNSWYYLLDVKLWKLWVPLKFCITSLILATVSSAIKFKHSFDNIGINVYSVLTDKW